MFSSSQKKVEAQFSEAECIKIDPVNRKVYCRSNINNNVNVKEEFVVDYDFLIIAVGANVNTFNTPGVTENCHFLKVTNYIYHLVHHFGLYLWVVAVLVKKNKLCSAMEQSGEDMNGSNDPMTTKV